MQRVRWVTLQRMGKPDITLQATKKPDGNINRRRAGPGAATTPMSTPVDLPLNLSQQLPGGGGPLLNVLPTAVSNGINAAISTVQQTTGMSSPMFWTLAGV